jgi:gliding motility-associated-like protein
MKIFCITLLFLFITQTSHSQLGFCTGSKGAAVFNENFGNGTTYGPPLPAGFTNYPFVAGAPNDGFYTLYNNTNLYSTWHNSLDHTPDASNGPNGKALIVNANAGTSGDFYKRTVTGLCINTTFEFSAWLMNVYNPGSGFCGAGQIPINVRFEIWNDTETVLLGSGNTGNITGSFSPNWQQFALVFTTTSQTTVVLKMKNNGLGGCGNDLAIDDIEFRACGNLTTITSPGVIGSNFLTCQNPISIILEANTTGSATNFYQWQSSTDNVNWVNIPFANALTYTTPSLTSPIFYRTKIAQDLANINNDFCSTISNAFSISFSSGPNNAFSNGDVSICSGATIPALSVTSDPGTNVNWYDAPTGGLLLLSNSNSYVPTIPGAYYAEVIDPVSNCKSASRTAVVLAIETIPVVTISTSPTICSGNSATINFTGTPNATVIYSLNGGTNQTQTLNLLGQASLVIPNVIAPQQIDLINISSGTAANCSQSLSQSITVNIITIPTASISAPATICSGSSAVLTFSGTPNAIVNYAEDGGPIQLQTLDNSGLATLIIPSVATTLQVVLISVASASLPACFQNLSQAVSINSITTPTATISALSPICSGDSSTINFSGTPNATITYTIDSGSNLFQTLDNSGQGVVVIPNVITAKSITLISVSLGSSGACFQFLSQSISVNVLPIPSASISAPSSICSGSSATINFLGTPNSIVSYSIDGGSTQIQPLDIVGQAVLIIPNVISTKTIRLVTVSSVSSPLCFQNLSQSIIINVNPIPTAVINVNPAVICANQNTTITFTGSPNATIFYTTNGTNEQSTVLDSSGNSTIVMTNLLATTSYELKRVSFAGTGCSQLLLGTAVVTVNQIPTGSFTGDLVYCSGETTSVNLQSNLTGTAFSWTVIQNDVIGISSGTGSQISQTLETTSTVNGNATYIVTAEFNGCSGNQLSINIVVNETPMVDLQDGAICLSNSSSTSGTPFLLDTELSATENSFQWFFGGNPIVSATGNTYQANQVGQYGVLATNTLTGCVSALSSAIVSEREKGESLIIQQSDPFSFNQTIVVNVVGGSGPFLYQLNEGNFQSSNTFYNVPEGEHIISVIDEENCTDLKASVTILNYPRFFTPNDDGFNDTWNITGLNPDAKIFIFDRYGKLLKQISTNGSGWDGTYNGQMLFSSDYWFTVTYQIGAVEKTFKAHFTLKR